MDALQGQQQLQKLAARVAYLEAYVGEKVEALRGRMRDLEDRALAARQQPCNAPKYADVPVAPGVPDGAPDERQALRAFVAGQVLSALIAKEGHPPTPARVLYATAILHADGLLARLFDGPCDDEPPDGPDGDPAFDPFTDGDPAFDPFTDPDPAFDPFVDPEPAAADDGRAA